MTPIALHNYEYFSNKIAVNTLGNVKYKIFVLKYNVLKYKI